MQKLVRFITSLILMLKIARRARRAKWAVSEAGICGLSGRAVTRVSPEGTIFVRNELWRARASRDIAEGESVRVTGLDGVMLEVVSLEEDRPQAPGDKGEKQLK
jgi:membrane-bound serine protease (ClpP class)